MKEQTLFEKYQAELQDDLKLDDFNLADKQMKLPGIKHKWVARLIQQRFEKGKLIKKKKEALYRIKAQLQEDSIVTISDRNAQLQAEQHNITQTIESRIKDCDNMILYLEKVEKIFSQITFDVKNIIDIRKMEML
jgi:hypothetical protein